jgi:tetratricopeptide (TPR) repeat protein
MLLSNLATISPANAQNMRGNIKWLKGEYADSVLFHLRALQLENNYPNARRDLAWSLGLMGLNDDSLAIGIADWIFIYLYIGRYDLLVNALAQSSPADQAVTENQRLMGQAYASMGDYEKALPLLETVWIDSGRTTGSSALSGFDIYDIAALIAARKAGQTETGTGNLVAAISSDLEHQKAAGRVSFDLDLNEGLAAWYAGDQEGAVGALLSAVNKGLYLPLDRDYLNDLYALPGFEVVREAQLAHIERERRTFLGEVCVNNVYADVWQPLPESCNGYLR